ncbi:MAG TPA: VacJ family lipoprotein [Caulobacteraceae bacterium]|nr:VacJ family lipoprotein [Caulobacteraceae bacterium]
MAGLVLLLAGSPALAQQAPGAGAPGAASAKAQIPDPWEGINRSFMKFTLAVDKAVIAPPVHAYRRYAPKVMQTAIRNVVYNLYEPRTFANDVLQLRFRRAGEATIRFAANSTVGLGGMIDVAGKTGLPAHESDFGQTLGRWGVPTGPYLFVPFYGPSDIRDGFGKLADAVGDPVAWTIGGIDTTFGQVRAGVDVAQARVDVDDTLESVRTSAVDPYATIHSGYSQNRAFMIDQAKGVPAAAEVNTLPDFGADSPAPQPGPAPEPAPTKP